MTDNPLNNITATAAMMIKDAEIARLQAELFKVSHSAYAAVLNDMEKPKMTDEQEGPGILDFIDAGATDSEPVKNITQGDLRRWHDDLEGLLGLIDDLNGKLYPCRPK